MGNRDVDIKRAITRVTGRIANACLAAGRSPSEVSLLIATKTQPISTIRGVIEALPAIVTSTPIIIGENRVQELVSKASQLPNMEIHYIGPLQKNKINQLLSTPITCIETIDSFELAEAINSRCNYPINVMLEVNVSGEASKAGCSPDVAEELAVAISALPNLNLTGFMTIGLRPIMENSRIVNSDEIRSGYRKLREIRDSINPTIGLSMGMSTDLELAIAEGATIVRVGTAIFGPR